MILSQYFLNSVFCNSLSTSSHSPLHILTGTEVKGWGTGFQWCKRGARQKEVCVYLEMHIHGPTGRRPVPLREAWQQLTVCARALPPLQGNHFVLMGDFTFKYEVYPFFQTLLELNPFQSSLLHQSIYVYPFYRGLCIHFSFLRT